MVFAAGAGEADLLFRRKIRLSDDFAEHELEHHGRVVIAFRGDCFLHIGEVDMSLFVKDLAADKAERLPALSLHGEFRVSGNVLSEVQNADPVRVYDQLRSEALVLRDIDIVGCDERRFGGGGDLGFSVVGRCHPRIVYLAVFQVGKADGAVLAPFPGIIDAEYGTRSVFVCDFQLREHGKGVSVHMRDSVGSGAAPIPAVR